MDLKDKSGIYIIHNTITKKVYIGSATDLYSRKNTHFYQLRHNKHHNKHLQRSWNKYGENVFNFYVTEWVEDKSKLLEIEQFWITLFLTYKPDGIYNINPKAGSMLGYKFSKEAREKMSKNNSKYNLGKHLSDETKKKLSDINVGRKHTDEEKLKMSLAGKGKPKSESFKKNKTGEKNGRAKLKESDVVDIKIKMLSEKNLSKIAREFNVGRTQISRIKNEKQWDWVKIPDEYLYAQTGDL